MKKRLRVLLHALALLLAIIVSIVVVTKRNKGYWDMAFFPGDTPARESEYPAWFEEGISQLIRDHSIPLGVTTGLAVYGAAFCLLEIKKNVKYFIALTFLYALPAFSLSFCAIYMIGGVIAGLALAIVCAIQRVNKGIWLSTAAIVHNLATAFLARDFFADWFRVFGD
jgi:hypothetical protein